MAQEEKELLLKDLCARLPYGVKCRSAYNKFPTTLVDVNVDANVGDDFFIVTVKLEKTGLNSPSLIEDIKPYLRSMSSMTEEDRRYLLEELGFDEDLENGELNDFGSYVYRNVNVLPLFDWLNAHHFDYHGLIEKGLALEAPEGMYKTNSYGTGK